jgi:chondroitin sulfate proteoglycan 4
LVRNPGPKECLGNEREVRICNPSSSEETPIAKASIEPHWTFGIAAIVGLICSLIAFFTTKYFMEKKMKSLRTIQGSPHYGSYPNQYSSLPTKDVRLVSNSITDNQMLILLLFIIITVCRQ